MNKLHLILLIIMYTGVNNSYWMTMFNVGNLPGNIFVNGVILGFSELLSSFLSGLFITYTSPTLAFKLFCIIAVVFNGINQFLFTPGSFLGYASLFVAILGVGGVYTCIFVITGIVFPKQNVGSALLLVVVISVSASFYAPIIVLYKAPIPFLVLTCMMAAAFASSVFLP